jgi:hypothetical protein
VERRFIPLENGGDLYIATGRNWFPKLLGRTDCRRVCPDVGNDPLSGLAVGAGNT